MKQGGGSGHRQTWAARLQRSFKSGLTALTLVAACHAAAVAQPQGSATATRPAEPRVTEYVIPNALAPRDPWPHSAGGVYFSMAGADKIVRFDVASRQFREWSLPIGSRPQGVAVGEDGAIFYAGLGDGSIGELDPRTGIVRRHLLSQPDGRPYSIALDMRGNVWVTMRIGAIAMLDRSTSRVTEYRMDGDPYGLAFDRTGILWVTCLGADKLRSFNPKTGGTNELSFDKGSKPRRLSIAGDGKVWVSLYGSGRLAAIDSTTNKVVKVYPMPGGANSGPYSVNVDPNGRIWVTEFQTDAIAVLEPATGAFKVISLPARSGVRNASIDGLGRYWFIASSTGTIGLIQ